MSKTDQPAQLYWIGQYDAAGRPLEFFGGEAGVYDPIPARDLTPAETAALTEAQWAAITSETGKRLYSATMPKTVSSSSSASTAVPSVTSSSSGESSPAG